MQAKKSVLTQKLVQHLFKYIPETGEIIWKKPKNYAWKGKNACSLNKKYYTVSIDRKNYMAHRIIWLYVHGYLPENDIDHIDRNSLNNRISNLREVSRSCNMRNVDLRSNSKSGVTGVSFIKKSFKWFANITVNGKTHSLGSYNDFYDAVCARLAAEQCLNWYKCDSASPAYQCLQKSLNDI